MNSNIAIKLSDDAFRVKAFAEYCSRAEERFANLLAATSSIVDYIPETDHELSSEEVSSIRGQVMTDYNLTESVVSLPDGYVPLTTLLDTLIVSANNSVNSIVPEGGTEAATFFDDLVVQGSFADGTVNNIETTYAEIGDSLQSAYHSIVCTSAAASAFYAKMTGQGSDVITIFNDKLGDIFSNVHADVSNSIGYLKGKLLETSDPAKFLDSILTVSGLMAESEATSEDPFTMANSDMAEFTGASPSCALDFSSSIKAVTTVAKVAAGVVVGIAKGIGSLCKSLFNKAKKFVVETVVDPDDLEIIDTKGFSTIDGFSYQHPDHYRDYDFNPGDGWGDTYYIDLQDGLTLQEEQVFLLLADLDKYSNKNFAMKSRFGEFMFKWSSVVHGIRHGAYDYEDIGLKGLTCIYRPRIVNINVIATCVSDDMFNADNEFVSFEKIEKFLENVSAIGDSVYDLTGLSEVDKWRGLIMAFYLDASIARAAYNQMTKIDATTFAILNPALWAIEPSKSSVTNLDWVIAAAGWNTSLSEFTSQNQYDFDYGVNSSMGEERWSVPLSMVKCAIVGLCYESLNPADEAPFVPFSNNHTDFETPSYRIKTDSTNKAAFKKFFETVVVIAVVAIIAVTATVIIKKLARKRYFKHLARQGRMDSKMWEGGTLSKREMRQYLRSSKIAQGSSLMSSSLISSVSEKFETSTTPPGSTGVTEDIRTLITG